MDVKSPKTSTLADGMIKRTSSVLDEIESKAVHKDKVIHRGKRSKTLSEVKPVENSTNLQGFLGLIAMQNEVLPSHKLQDHAYE